MIDDLDLAPERQRALAKLVAKWERGGRVGPHPLSARGRFERGEDPLPARVEVWSTPILLPPWRPPR